MSSETRHGHRHSDFAFWFISLMHDNPLLPIFRNPYRFLEAAGLKPGQKVLEVGCGPGFFTIPAARIVGHEGFVYAVDVHPRAIERVEEKARREGIANVQAAVANASDTGLPDRSIDLAFLFGLAYVAGGLEDVVSEMHRILKPEGVLALENTRGSKQGLIDLVQAAGFTHSGNQRRILLFTNAPD